MESTGLGEMRLLQELEKRYHQKKIIVVDKEAVECPDGSVRMRATELHADLLGKRKTELNVTGSLEVKAADMSPEERRKWIDEHFDEIAKARGWKPPDENKPT